MAKIEIANSAGFCFGVKRALDIANNLNENGKKVFTYGPIIHNRYVIEDMKNKGIDVVEQIDKTLLKNSTLVLRSHGVKASIIQQLEQEKISFVDATCPFVKKIHNIVKNMTEDNILFIAGDKNHPEVIGIMGNTKATCYAFNCIDELSKILKNNRISDNSLIYLVSQTTFSTDEWNKCLKLLKKVYTNLKIFDTICSATAFRQKEAIKLAKKSDLMIVIGGKNSSNTKKLKDICSKYCKTYLVESASELPMCEIKHAQLIGITAGASTPVEIIEEVTNLMEDKINKGETELNQTEQSFEEMLEESLKGLNSDSKVKGTVVGISHNEVYVDVGRKQAGIIPISELTADKNARPEDIVKVGDELDLLILKTNDQEGTIMLSKKKLDASKGWDILEAAQKEGTILSGKVSEIVKGGIIVITKENLRVFIPASLASISRNFSLDELKGKEVNFKVIEVNKAHRRAVGSIKAVLEEQRKALAEKFWENAEVGKKYSGVVRSLTKYGAFVDLGGIDGMIHISELSWQKIKSPADVLNIGDTVEVYIKDLDRERGRISLGYKKAEDNPWEILKNKYPEGSVLEVQVVGIAPFGAFARILPGIDGLIHISQIANNRTEKVEDVLSVGDRICVKIIGIDFDKKRVALSIKALDEEESKQCEENAQEN